MEPVGIFLLMILISFLAFKATVALGGLILERDLLRTRVNILEIKCGEKVTDFNKASEPPPRIEHNYYVPPEKPKPLIQSDVLMFMIKCCHPDKFVLSEDKEKQQLAKEATNWLVGQKNKQKEQGF